MSDIFDDIHRALKDRKQWDRKQELWHRLRFSGIKRTNLPYEGAPNVTYPLADTMIEKLKPLFLQQIYAPQTVATFVSRQDQETALSKLAEQWFDYQLKQSSNFEKAIHSAIDEHLQDGFCVVKIRWDDKKDQLVLEGIDPLYIITPWYSEALQEVDWLVHVYKVSVDQYKRNPVYSAQQSDDFIAQIKGRSEDSGQRAEEQDRQVREGITQVNNDQQIVLWEVYYRDQGGNWLIRTISPIAEWDTPIREMPLPESYKGQLPFVKISCDLNESGWYSPRGVCEIAARFQQSLSKQWCNQLQWMDYNAQPDFKNTSGAPVNAQNFQRRPGGVLPPGIEPNRANEMPADFVEQMQFVRALAEDRIQMPDLNSGEHLAGTRGAKGEITATQVDAIVGQSNQGNDMRSRVFRLQMAEVYRMCWQLLVKNSNPDEMTFLQDAQIIQVPKEALHLDYEIRPSGSADSWNTSAQAQKAMMVYQLWNGQPGVNQRGLKEWLAERVDVQLIKRVLTSDADDALQALQTISGFVQGSLAKGSPITPDVAQLLLALGQQELMELQQKGDSRVQGVMQEVAPMAQMLTQIAQQPQAAMMGAGQPQGGKSPSESINYKDAPPSIRRQMEAQAGMTPATPEESALEVAQKLPKDQAAGGAPGAPTDPMKKAKKALGQPVPPEQVALHPDSIAALASSIQHPPPVVNVAPPAVNVAPPMVRVAPPEVHVHPKPEPVKKSGKKKITFNHGKDGKLAGALVEEA